MKNIIIFFVFLIPLTCVANKIAFEPPEELICDYLENPLGIDVESPRLSWQLKSNLKNQVQTGYQILVASSLEKLNEDEADIWNSGKVESGQSIHVAYKGISLKSKQRYYWKVRVWDKDNNPSSFSEVAFWEMGLLDKSDWTAKWITAPRVYEWPAFIKQRRSAAADSDLEEPDAAPQFRKPFYLKGKPISARLYITGLGYYVPFLNGKKIGVQILDPGFTRYDKSVLYSTYDVTENLQEGENAIGVVLGNGWYNMVSRGAHGFDLAPWRDQPTFISQLEITFDDGTAQLITSDETWKVAPGPIVFNSVRQGEFYDARQELPGWNKPGYSDSNWYSPIVTNGPMGELKAQMMPPIKIMEEIKPVKVGEPKDGHYLFDLGRNIAGFAKIKVQAPAGTEIMLKYGEKLSEEGLIDQTEISRGIMDKPFQTDKYITKGEGIEEWHPVFTYHGFQYVEVTGISDPEAIVELTGLVVHTAFDPAGNFECSNELFNKIHHATLNAYKGNYHSVPTDCPQREKNAWTADAHLAAEMAMYNFNNQRSYIKWLQDIADEQRPSGEIPAIIPTSGWGYHWGNGPAWDNALVLIPWYLYKYSGDVIILEEMYPHIKRYVDYISERGDNYILDFGLGDWAPAKMETPVALTSTAYYYVDAVLLSEMAGILGYNEDQQQYDQLSKEIKEAYNEKFYLGDGIYANGSQTSLSASIYQGLTEDNIAETMSKLVTAVEQNDNHLDAGILGTKYLLHALSDNGRADLAYNIVNQRTFPGWGYWIEQGATTLWEKWDGSMSHNHVMFGDVGAWFYKDLAGIKPDLSEAGFKRIIFQPHFIKDLSWVNASHNSLYGEISASWKREGERISYKISIPANTSGVIILPEGKRITIDGRTLTKAGLVKRMWAEDNMTKFILGSGNYSISIK